MKLAIDIDGVLRDTFLKIEQTYQKFFIDELELVDEDFKFEIKTPYDTPDYQNHFMFKNEEEYFSFLYEEFTMQIFGHAPSSEMSTFHVLSETYKKYKDKVDFMLISKQIGKTKPATLFFISKFGCEIDKVVFYNKLTENKIWDEFDVLLTANPELLNQNHNKTLIKYETLYNSNITSELSIKSLKDLDEEIEKLIE
jgi:FMN phosphatase YigB (HAD superfamily)